MVAVSPESNPRFYLVFLGGGPRLEFGTGPKRPMLLCFLQGVFQVAPCSEDATPNMSYIAIYVYVHKDYMCVA